MPWYAPTLRAPPASSDRGNNSDEPRWNDEQQQGGRQYEEVVEMEQTYLDEEWNYRDQNNHNNNNGHGSSNGGHSNFHDGYLQHQIENQLGNLFPSGGFAPSTALSASNNFATRHSTSINHCYDLTTNNNNNPQQQQQSAGYSQNDHPNLKYEGGGNGGIVMSKTAQFFYPRPVIAMKPYANFFSPMQFPDGEETGKMGLEDCKPPPNFGGANIMGGGNGRQQQLSQGGWSHKQPPSDVMGGNRMGMNDNRLYQQEVRTENNNVNINQQWQRGLDDAPDRLDSSGNQQLSHPQRDIVDNRHGVTRLEGNGKPYKQPSRTPPKENGDQNALPQFVQPNQGKDSGIRPKDLFDATHGNDNPFIHLKATKQPPKQSKLVQDSETGQVMAKKKSKPNASKQGENRKAASKGWDDYGGRPMEEDNQQRKEKAKEKAKVAKEKKDKTKKKGSNANIEGGKGGGGMDSFLTNNNKGKKRPNNDSSDDDGNAKQKKKSEATPNKTKKTKRKKNQKDYQPLFNSSTELSIPTYDKDDDGASPEGNYGDTTPATITENDFEGIGEMELQNAACSYEGLEQFLRKVGHQRHVSFTMVFLDPYTGNYTLSRDSDDNAGGGKKRSKKGKVRSKKFAQKDVTRGYECTTSFLPTSKAYCTPKGPTCTAWNCTCEDQIRGMRASAALLGAMFVLKDVESTALDDNTDNGGEWQCFLLPLGPTSESTSTQPEVEYSRMTRAWPVIPFGCEVSLSDRWSAFEALLRNRVTKLVTYNATVSLLPFYHHLDKDTNQSHVGDPTFGQFSAYIAGGNAGANSSNQNPIRDDGYLQSIWDLRLVSWMLRPHATDKELELSTFKEGFAHLAPGHQIAPKSGMTHIMQGLAEAKNSLELIYALYPIMNRQTIEGELLNSLELIEAPVQSILASMESRGIVFKPQRLRDIEVDLEARIETLETQSRSITKDPSFMLSSPQQVSAFLFDVLKLKMPANLISKTKAGSSHRSTSEETLKGIKAEMTSQMGSSAEILDIILDFRRLNKLLTTYIKPLPLVCRRVHSGVKSKKRSKENTYRIYPQWMQTAVRTGRLSCRKPNLQQIPKSGLPGVHPRSAFVAEKGMCLFACDYSQKEVRIMAHMANDPNLIKLFTADPNVDIYKQMSSVVRNIPIDAITDKDRAQFKQVTLAILYGMSPNQVAKNLSITRTGAEQLMKDFFRRFPRVKPWMEETKREARRNSYVKTIAGRKRYLDDINSSDNAKRSQAERQAINTVVQGSAADLMKSAMINLASNLTRWEDKSDPTGKSRPRMLLQIHDEAIFELRLNEADIKQLQEISRLSCCNDCEKFFKLKVPLLLNCSAGVSWAAMKEI